jgi:hypothetical protein
MNRDKRWISPDPYIISEKPGNIEYSPGKYHPPCFYLRHLDEILAGAGVELGPGNQKEVDLMFKELLTLSSSQDVWMEVK